MDPLLNLGVALITGSGSGIGQETAIQFAHHGCRKLFLVDLSMPGLQKTELSVKEASPDAIVQLHVADISNEESVKAMIDQCVEIFGRLDFACNNAGKAAPGGLTHEMTLQTFELMNKVNIKGTLLCQKYELAAMLQQAPLSVPNISHVPRGSIVNTASMAGLSAMPTIAAYGGSKHGVVSMTRVDARQHGPNGIRINSVSPGFVDTPMLRGEMSEEWVEGAAKQAPMNRLVDPSEVAEGVVFLSGSLATAVTGVSLPVDCGGLLYRIS